MVLISSPQAAPTVAGVSILEPGGGDSIGRTFTIAGMAPGCAQVTIEIRDSSGTLIIPATTAIPDSDGYYTTNVTVMGDFSNASITVYCTAAGVGTGQTIGGVNIQLNPIIDTFALFSLPVGSTPPLQFTVKFNPWMGTDQSVTLVLHRYSATSTSKFEHMFSSNPPATQTYTIPFPDKGVYVAQFLFVNSLTTVTSRTYTKKVN